MQAIIFSACLEFVSDMHGHKTPVGIKMSMF